jgi:hypothetical protein
LVADDGGRGEVFGVIGLVALVECLDALFVDGGENIFHLLL